MDASLIMFPIPDDDVSLEDFRGAFPNMTSLRYTDGEDSPQHHVLCRDGKFRAPDGGWAKQDRLYLAVCQSGPAVGVDRFGLFASYRNQLSTKNPTQLPAKGKKIKGKAAMKSEDEETAVVHVGHGHFRNGKFSRISVNNLSSEGGIVVVGPVSKSEDTADEIKEKSVQKFCELNRWFRKKHEKSTFVLLYPDGSKVSQLPNGEKFSLAGYRDYINPHLRFDRIRLFICEKRNYECSQPFDLLSASSSDEDDALPQLTSTPKRANAPELDTNAFSSQPSSAIDLEEPVQPEPIPEQRITDRRFQPFHIAGPSQVRHRDEDVPALTTVGDCRPISGEYNSFSSTATELVERTLTAIEGREEPTLILKEYKDRFLLGRSLDLTTETETVVGETSTLFISRRELLIDAMEELESVENLRFPLEIIFYGEGAHDLGGPRREFLTLAIHAIKETLLEKSVDDKITLVKSPEFLSRHRYYYSGLLIGLSALEDGPMADFLMDLLDNRNGSEEMQQLLAGLERVGLLQLIDRTKTIRFLFMPSASRRMVVNRFLRMFHVQFSEDGSNARQKEEKAYKRFLTYVREVYAGRRGDVSLNKIMRFVTGLENEPVLGFNIPPSIAFVDGTLPFANTCINRLSLPLVVNYEMLDIAFMNEYFGYE